MKEIIIDINKFRKEKNLTFLQFIILSIVFQTNYKNVEDIFELIYKQPPESDGQLETFKKEVILPLRDHMYIALIEGNILFREKADKLFLEVKSDLSFSKFWEEYHSLSGKKKTNSFESEKYWNRLTKREKKEALSKIKDYIASVDEPRYIVKARTYLSKKLFHDEYEEEPSDDFITRA